MTGDGGVVLHVETTMVGEKGVQKMGAAAEAPRRAAAEGENVSVAEKSATARGGGAAGVGAGVRAGAPPRREDNAKTTGEKVVEGAEVRGISARVWETRRMVTSVG